MRVLVAYATKSGATAEIAETVAKELVAMGLEADARPAASVKNVREYDAVLLGSAIYIGRWRGDALRFAKRFAVDLLRRPVWLFDSGPLDASTDAGRTEPVPAADEIAKEIGAKGRTTFGGRLKEKDAGFFMRRLMASGRVGSYGDFRNFERARRWAHGIGAELLASQSRVSAPALAIAEPASA